MKKILILPLALFFLVQGSMAQTPKWVEKAKRAVFSVVTYDKNDKMLNTGNGFFVSEDGLALSDFSLFKGAERAVVVTADGKQMPVSRILGANDMYDVIKFRVGKCLRWWWRLLLRQWEVMRGCFLIPRRRVSPAFPAR